MNKTKIEWTDYTWNPIKGLCPTGCWYCYARRMYQRFKWDSELALQYSTIDIYKKEWPKKPSKIFVCSTIEMFHPEIPKDWRDEIFETIKEFPQHTFQILTKFPQNIDREMPDNVWLGVTITKWSEFRRLGQLKRVKARIRFVSYEPLFPTPLPFAPTEGMVDWIVVGKLTGFGKKDDPGLNQIKYLVDRAKYYGVPIFLKDNLKEIWGENLMQEFPE